MQSPLIDEKYDIIFKIKKTYKKSQMDYFTEFFGFKKDPFETNHDISNYYMSSVHKPVLARLYRSVYEDGIDVLFGEDGTGKTITVKKFLSELKKTKHVYIPYTDQSIEEIIRIIAESVSEKSVEGSISDYLSAIEETTRDIRLVVVIDNVQEASLNVIENLRILSDAKNLKLILVGNENLEHILRMSSMRQLSTRVRNFLFLKNMNKKDTRKYIDTKLFNAGGNVKISKKVYKLVYEITKGNPYKINLIMDEALYLASLKKKKKIKSSTIKKAAKNLGFKVKKKIGIFGWLIILILLAIVSIFVYFSGLLPVEQFLQGVKEEKVQVEETPVKQETPVEEKQTVPEQEKTTGTPIMEEEKTEKQMQEQVEKQKEPVEATVNVSFLNIRENPDTNSRILAVVPKGYKVKILEEGKDNWVKVLYFSRTQNREIIGWVNKKYLSVGQ